jgi:hypothetical protein
MITIETTQRLLSLACLAAATLLAGCAGMHTLDTSVANFGAWPADVTPGTYAFERLPSQEANQARQQLVENAAASALATAGFTPAADGTKPAVTIQVGARIQHFEPSPWDDPFWWGGPYHYRYGYGYGYGWYGRYGGWYGPWGPYGWHHGYWGPYAYPTDVYLREVALLIRDASTGKPLYETRASSDSYADGGDRLLAAMFDASMKDFPRTNDQAHNVRVELPPVPSATPPGTPAMPASAPSA